MSLTFLIKNNWFRRIFSPALRRNGVERYGDLFAKLPQPLQSEDKEWMNDWKREVELMQKREAYNREFIANAAHELKTPIFNVQGYLHTLLDGAMNDPQVNRKYLQKAVANAERLSLIAADLEMIHELESGKQELSIRKVNIAAMTREVFETFEGKARSAKILLKYEGYCIHPLWVMADGKWIRQALENLIDNSIKYGRPNGCTEVHFHDFKEHLLLEITDNGIGIQEEHLPRIFERFYRVDKSRSREKGGTGLGLSIVRHIIEAHEQRVHVRSKEGEGTTFGFTMKKT